jgi:hypothetical protein
MLKRIRDASPSFKARVAGGLFLLVILTAAFTQFFLPDRLPHLHVDLPAPDFGCIDGVGRFVLAGLSVADAHKLSVPLQSGLGPAR